MTRIAKLLKDRVIVLKPVKVANTAGGFDRSYLTITQLWSEIKPIAQASRDISHFAAYIRGTQVSSVATHKMKCRRTAVQQVGAGFSTGFNRGYVREGTLEILKSEYYILRQRGSERGAFTAGYTIGYEQTIGLIGNLFRVISGVDDGGNHEFLEMRLKEVEEQGTGAGE